MTRNALLLPLALLLPMATAASGCDAAGRARSDAHHMEMERRMLELEMRVDTLDAENRQLRLALARLENERTGGAGTDAADGAPASGVSVQCTATRDGYALRQSDIDALAADMSGIAREARIIPHFENGKANGFKVFGIRPGSFYASCGLQNGDVVARVNGMELTSPDRALKVYSAMREATTIDVELIRGGKPARVKIEITGS